MAFTPIDEEEIINEPVAEEAKPRFIPIEDDEFFGIVREEEAPEPAPSLETPAPVEAPKSRFTPISDDEFFGVETQLPAAEEPRDNSWDTLRGLEVSMRQVPQLAYGVAGLVGETAEQLTGYGESLRDFGFKGYQDWAQSMEPISKETDDVTVAWQRAKEGDIGALVDWAQYGVGYALGQLGETAAVAVLGGIAGGAAAAPAGPAAVPVAAGGAVVAAAGKQGFKSLAKNLVEKAIANQANKIVINQAKKEGVELTAEQVAKRAQQEAIKRQAGKEIGSNAAVFANAIGMQLGSIYGSAEEQARAEGRELTGVDLARIWGTGVATGGIEGVVDKFGLDLLKGKLSDKLPAGRLAGAAVAGGVGTLGEAATEAVQTVGERFGAGRELLSDEAINEYINASALGGLGGGTIGGVGGFISGNPKENAAAKAKVSSEANKEIAPATAETVARQADAVIAETVQETPDQRVARLQEEATAAAGIELEEEVPVSGLPPQPVTPTPEAPVTTASVPVMITRKMEADLLSRGLTQEQVNAMTPQEANDMLAQPSPTPEGAVAPVEPVVEPVVTEPQPVAEVAPEIVQQAEQRAIADFAEDLYGNEPYVNHLRRVSDQMPNDKLKTAAFLHDSVEDGKMTLDEVRSQFGDDVAGLVDIVSRKDDETYSQFIDRIAQNPEASQIKLADLRENIRNVEDFKPSLRSRYEKAIAKLEAAQPAVTPPAEVEPVTPNLEPLRRVARAEQVPEDVPSLVDAGLVEVYKDQPVLTETGIAQLPEAERPRLNPEARKIQIDTGSNEVVAEAIAKGLRIGVDQVGFNVRMPAGWVLDGDIYVPPTPQEVGEEVTVYRGELPALEGGRQLAGIRDFGELVGLPDDVALAPFTYYSTSEQDARGYLERDARILKDYQDRFGEEEGMKMFQSLHGFNPRTEGQVVSKKIRPRKVFDITEMGTTADFAKMYELVAKEMGYTLPENWRWKDVPREVTDEVNRYGLDIVGDPDDKQPTWQYFRNEMDRTRAALIQRGLSERTKEDVRGSLFAQWLRKNGYDAVAMMHDTDAGPVKHILVINEDAAKSQENLVQQVKPETLALPPAAEVVPEVVPPRPADVEPEPAAEQELQSVVDKYQTSEPTARMILANLNFMANEAGVIPDGWTVERIDGDNIALSPVWQKSRGDIQVALRKLTTIERGALSARLSKEGWINEEQAKEYLQIAISSSSQEQVTAAEAEANERFDALVERIVGENRANVSSVVGEVSKPKIDLESEEQARAEKPAVSPNEVLDPNEIEFMSARQALKKLAEANIIYTSESFPKDNDTDAQGNAKWRTVGNIPKPRYVLLQEAASVLAQTNLRGLDAERINVSSDKSGRANRAYAGNIFIPRTEGGGVAYLEPWVLLHEIGHTLTSDAFQKHVPDKGLNGADYYKQLKDALKNKKVPREVRRAITLYIDTIKALGFEKEYFKKGGLASNNADRGLRNAAARTSNKLINPFTGNEITRDDMYALADMHEFYAQAWNSESFQDILKQIKVEPQRSAFQKFVDIIKDVLGFESDTMAYSVIDISLRLAALESETDTGATIEERIESQKELRAVKELPRTKMRWTNFDYGKFGGDRVKMSRNKFVKLGYDIAHFTINRSSKGVFGGGGNEWTMRVAVKEFYSKGKNYKQLLPDVEIFVRTFDSKASAQEFSERIASDINGMVNEKYGPLKKGVPTAPTRGKPASRPRYAPAPEVRESRREPSVEMRQQYAPKTEEEQKAFDKASTNKVLARSPQLAVAAVRMKNGEITAGDYADLVDAIDPFTAKGPDPVATDDKIKQYIQSDKVGKVGLIDEKGNPRLQEGSEYEFRIDIPTYNRSTTAGDTVYAITAHLPVADDSKTVGEVAAFTGIAKVTDPRFMTRNVREGGAITIAAGAGKFRLATVKGNYEPITDLPADINDPNVWTEVGYNPIRSSFFVDTRSKDAVVGGSEAIMVGSRVFVKDAVLEPRPTGVTMGERYAKIQMPRPAGMETEAVATKLESLGFGRGGIVSVVNEPDASFEGRTIIRDGKVVSIELNAAALKDDAAVERVLNHEIAESANADGALNTLVAGLTPKERKEINDAITRLGYAEKARTAEEAARAVELLAEGWRGRKWFDRAVARVEAWANKLGYKLTRRAAEYIAARNVSEINAEFKQAYNKFINVQGEAREGRAFVTPAENARFLELAKDPEANREELQRMVDEAARRAGYNRKGVRFGFYVKGVPLPPSRSAELNFGPGYYVAEDATLENTTSSSVSVSPTANPKDLEVLGLKPEDVEFRRDTVFVKAQKPLRSAYGGNYDKETADLINAQLAYDSAVQEARRAAGIDFEITTWGKTVSDLIASGRLPFDSFQGMTQRKGVSSELVVQNASQIKSADPVTRDDQGNVIPLSERFQTTTADIRYSIRESRREDAIPTFSEGSPEASTLSTMAASMAKVDGASEAKPNPENKPTYKISEIASVWMDQGGDVRQLQDLISENTNLTPTNAAKVANAIAKQYDIQQSIATAFLETQIGLSVEALPEGVTLPKEVDPDRPRPVMARLFDVFMGVRVPPVKIQVNEKAALKDQIRLKAAANRAAKAEQKRTAEEVVEIIKAMELLGPVRPKQVQALAKRAARVIWTSEKSVEAFSEYAAKVVENTNYDADLREAKDAQKRAKQLSTQKKVAMSPQREVLGDISKIPVNKLDDPRMFAEAVNYYLRGFKAVLSPDYVVIPDAEMESYLSGAQSETQRNQRDLDREANERLAKKYGIEADQVNEMMESIDIIKQIEAQENREALDKLLTEKAVETQQGLREYNTDNLRSEQRPIVSSMLKVDPKALDPEERQRFIRITNNIIYNNQTNGAEYFVAVAKGQQSAREAAQDSEMIAKNRAWINLLPRFVSERMQRGWALELQSIADTFRNAFGKGAMAKVYDAMGMLDLNLGFTKANNTIDEIQKKIAEFHRGIEKKYKETARNQDGLLAEGIVGFLIQSIPKKDEVTSINQRRDLIRQDIANRRRSAAQPDRIAMADRIETILNQIDGDSVEAILNNMKRDFPPNYESLIWYKDTLLPQYKDFLKNFDENFNDQANNYDNPNYLTIGFTSAGPSLAITTEEQGLFYNQVSLNPKQSAYTIKRVDYSVLPKDRTTDRPKEIEFNLRRNVFNGLSDQINKAYTSSGWQRIASFMKTPEAETVFGGAANKDFFIERLNRLRLSRMRRGSMGSGGAIEKAVDSLSIISRKLGTGIALGGIYQWIKQPPDQLITAWGSGGRGDLLAKNIAPKTQKLARTLLNKFSIGRRGDASAGYKYINQMEGHQNRLERYFSESKWDQAKEQAGNIADVWMVALKSSDFLAASAAWMTYYEGELNKQDIKIDDWSKEADLIESDPKRRQAAAFAEQMTDIYQGSSDPTSMATFAQSGKTGWENFVKAIFVPFNSFAIQQRMRLYSDARDALNGSKSGVGGLSGTIGGLILFHSTKRYVIPAISGVGIGVLYGLMGVDMDEPDEEKQKEEANKNWRQFLADLTGNLLVGGTPQLVETQVIDAMNRASYLVSLQLENDSILNDEGEIMSYDQYSKERSPFYRYKSYDNAMSLGMLDIGMGQVEQVALQTKMLASPEEMEMYTPEEQRLLYFSALSEWLLLMRLNDTDFARLVGKARRDMIKAAEDREKAIKAIRSGR